MRSRSPDLTEALEGQFESTTPGSRERSSAAWTPSLGPPPGAGGGASRVAERIPDDDTEAAVAALEKGVHPRGSRFQQRGVAERVDAKAG
jgi:hypothetical protein